ncbi:hypothetical protein SSX86_008937 [Deinandra increscens subsp. villosa]|uniref:Ankyrin repeat-containing protein n=1 Tax=Deinandra increscens subsp. villosa TaxID=3103831 RepID=A0AAP0DK46_9ASTR
MDRNLFEASMIGNVQVLNELLEKDQLILDRVSLIQFSETPLHIAALRGHLDFIKVLLRVKPALAMSLDSVRRTALHVASAGGHVEIVRELLHVMSAEGCSIRDGDGRTALDLAVANEQLEIVKLLIQTNRNVLDHCPPDSEADFQRSQDVKSSKTFSQNVNKGNWLEKNRGILMLATIVVATSSFYSGLHPPTFTDSRDGPLGTAIETAKPDNTIIMVLSLTIFVVLISGIPLRNKFCLWVLNLATLCIMFFVTISYLGQISNMSPDGWVNPTTMFLCFAWMFLCLVFALFHTVFFVTWVIKKLLKARKRIQNSDRIADV